MPLIVFGVMLLTIVLSFVVSTKLPSSAPARKALTSGPLPEAIKNYLHDRHRGYDKPLFINHEPGQKLGMTASFSTR